MTGVYSIDSSCNGFQNYTGAISGTPPQSDSQHAALRPSLCFARGALCMRACVQMRSACWPAWQQARPGCIRACPIDPVVTHSQALWTTVRASASTTGRRRASGCWAAPTKTHSTSRHVVRLSIPLCCHCLGLFSLSAMLPALVRGFAASPGLLLSCPALNPADSCTRIARTLHRTATSFGCARS